MTVQELMAKRATAWEAAKRFMDTHTMENGCLSSEDAQEYERMEADIKSLTDSISRLERMQEMEREMGKPEREPVLTNPQNVNSAAKVEKDPRSAPGYHDSLMNGLRSKFRNVDGTLNEGTDTEGGYLVPIEWDPRLHDILEDENVMRRLSTVITTRSERKFNLVDEKPQAAWMSEGGAINFSTATFKQKSVNAYKVGVGIRITEELLYDNTFGLENYIITKMGEALAHAEEDAFLNGNTDGRPTGLFNPTDGGVFSTKVSTGTGGAPKLSPDDVLDLIYNLRRPYRRNAAFLMSDSILPIIRKLKDANQAYIWQPSYQAGEPDRLCGYPIYTSVYAPTFPTAQPSAEDGDKAICAFGDFKYYYICDRGPRSFKMLDQTYAENGLIGYIMKERTDGLLINNEAVQILYAAAAE